MPSTPSVPPVDPEQQPGIAIAQIFLERLSFEHRSDPLTLPPNTPPTVGELKVTVEVGLSPDHDAGVTRVSVFTDATKDPVYNVQVTITAIFTKAPAAGGMPLEQFLHQNSLALVYPFIREAFAAVTQRGRFGPVWLNPFNTLGLVGKLGPQQETPKA